MLPSRRGFLLGLSALAAPAIIRTPGLLMPIRRLVFEPDPFFIEEAVEPVIYFRTRLPAATWRFLNQGVEIPYTSHGHFAIPYIGT